MPEEIPQYPFANPSARPRITEMADRLVDDMVAGGAPAGREGLVVGGLEKLPVRW